MGRLLGYEKIRFVRKICSLNRWRIQEISLNYVKQLRYEKVRFIKKLALDTAYAL